MRIFYILFVYRLYIAVYKFCILLLLLLLLLLKWHLQPFYSIVILAENISRHPFIGSDNQQMARNEQIKQVYCGL